MPPPSDGPFRTRTALAAGESPYQLRQPWLGAPLRGVRTLGAHDPDDIAARCRAATLVLPPQAAFSHVTALRLLGVEVPWRAERRLDSSLTAPEEGEPLHVVAPRRSLRSTRAGIVWHFCGQQSLATTQHHGLPVTSAAQTWLHLSHGLTIDDLVVLGDAMLRRAAPVTSLDELRRLTESTHKMRGLAKARVALDLIRAGTDSSMETRARLLLVHAGLPCPVVNRAAVDDEGRFLALPDMSYPQQRIAIEYDGDVHRTDPATWRRDVERRQRLEAAGWQIITATADDVLRHPERFVARVRTALQKR
jgi:hypothetical protein